jgi:hypothetical protein
MQVLDSPVHGATLLCCGYVNEIACTAAANATTATAAAATTATTATAAAATTAAAAAIPFKPQPHLPAPSLVKPTELLLGVLRAGHGHSVHFQLQKGNAFAD